MDTQCYQVEVLHYLNPHLIWVEVTDPAFSKDGEFLFEQVGFHGILPLETTINEVEGSIVTRRGDWMPAASLVLRDAFEDATEVYFLPTHIERRTSIFDNNIHKYGDFITITHSGKKRRVSKLLTKSGYAKKDECAFYQELCSGNLKTKLSPSVTSEVISRLEKHYLKKNCSKKEWEKSVKKCTMIHNQIQNLECQLTEQNLKTLAKDQKNLIDVESLLQKKSKDFEICKDADEVSMGRGVHRDKKKELNTSLLQKKLKLIEERQDTSSASIFQMTKKFLVKNAVVKDSDVSENNENINIEVTTSTPNKEKNDVHSSLKLDHAEQSMSSNNWVEEEYVKPRKPKKASKNKRLIPEYDIKTQTRVAFGPPEADQSLLTLKVVPRFDMLDTPFDTKMPSVKPINVEEENSTQVVSYGDVDGVLDDRFDINVDNSNINSKVEIRNDNFDNSYRNLDVKGDNIDDNKIKVETASSNTEDNKNKEDSNDVDKVKLSNSFQKHMALKAQSKSNDVLKKAKEIALKQKDMSPNDSQEKTPSSSLLKRKLRLSKESEKKLDTSQTSNSDTSIKDSSTSYEESKPKVMQKIKASTDSQSDDENIEDIVKKIDLEYSVPTTNDITDSNITKKIIKHKANPFKNVEANLSVFVDKLVSPILMVHSKKNNRIQPSFKISDMHFSSQILNGLKILKIESPKMLQTISWLTIMRGYSLFMISPKDGGKTIGYLPAVCRLISDSNNEIYSVGPICIIVCATANSVTQIERLAKCFMRQHEKILACYSGMSELDLATSMLNGCELLICTPSILVRLLKTEEFGVDLKRLQTFVLDDCERLGQVYVNEIKFFFLKIKEMLKKRVVKELKVQVILASRIWCDFMTPLAKKAPDTVICIGDFQECVLYSKANMQATFVEKENKIDSVLKFMEQTDRSKKAVIVCRTDDEVEAISNALKDLKYVVFSADNTMDIHGVYALNLAWEECEDQVSAPVLVCCDRNLYHMNITDAHYLVHYSLPHLFSAFCRRFAVLNDNYPSIFTDVNENVKIKILLEQDNIEELPKILHFIKRCTQDVPKVLDELCENVLKQKDRMMAKHMVPICDSMLTLGECPDFWSCKERHAVIKEYDEPLSWMPNQGVVTFKISYYHTATFYSARLLTNTYKGETTKYPQNYNTLSMKIATYFATESNRMLHGTPKLGDIAAVAIKQNYFVRCQVVKILNYYKNDPPGRPEYVLVRLRDEERLEKTKDIYLYYLPEALKQTNTHVVQVRLANIKPKDKDITFSDLAKDVLKNVADSDETFMRGEIKLAIANCLIVDKLEACRDLSQMNKVVVRANFKEVLESHAMDNPEHVPKLEKLCQDSGVTLYKNIEVKHVVAKKPLSKPRWAHLEKDDLSSILFASAESPSTFFVRLVKFEKCLHLLIKDIQKLIEDKPEYLTDFKKGEIVLAELPDDGMYERARIDEVYEGKVKCFFVDHGDWRDVSVKRIAQITEKLVTQLPFQAIECRLVGVLPAGETWTEFATNWFTTCFEDKNGDLKQMFIKYFTKEKSSYTGGHKYGVAVIDTNGDKDIVINNLIVDVNMGRENESEIIFLDNLNFERITNESTESTDEDWEQVDNIQETESNEIAVREPQNQSLDRIFMKKPIRSVPLVDSDYSDDDKFDINMIEDFLQMTNLDPKSKLNNLLAIENGKTKDNSLKNIKSVQDKVKSIESSKVEKVVDSSSDISAGDTSSSAIVVLPSPRRNALDSDDLTSSVSSQLTEKSPIPEVADLKVTTKIPTENVLTEKSHKLIEPLKDTINTLVDLKNQITVNKEDELPKPKLCWRQNKEHVVIKIILTGVEDYKLKIEEKHLKFEAEINATKYGFDVEMYGVIDVTESKHCNKGRYIQVTLKKILKRNWLTLTRNGIKRWIVYDVDHIDDSSSEEDEYCTPASVFKHTLMKSDSESEDEFMDDVSFKYKKYD